VTDGKLGPGTVFVDMSPGGSDGIRCDVDGTRWAAAGGVGPGYNGVHVFHPDGTMIGRVCLPEGCAHLCFGGAAKNRLLMTAGQSVYGLMVSLHVSARGC
jgi:gluconolactonase